MRFAIVSSALALLAACGDPDCPDGTHYVHPRCVPVDAGADGSVSEGGVPADGGDDAAAPTDGSAGDAASCPATMCDGDCVDTTADSRHCGECGNACGTDLRCIGGSCIDAIVEVDAGDQHTCALRGTGSVLCWGDNRSGELGDGTTTERHEPAPVSGITDAVQIELGGFSFSASTAFTCARLRTGSVMCWGHNDDGTLGDGTTDQSSVPREVVGITDAVDVDAGMRHACAVRAGGTVYCWGYNEFGQLGSGTTSTDPVVEPVPVSGISTAVAVSAGGTHTCALLEDGSLRCWGNGETGALGENRHENRSSPVEVVGIDDATDVLAGLQFTCALRGAGSVECWGSNQYGNLGRETGSGTQPLPFPIMGPRDFVQLAGAYFHTCGVRAGGEMQCWGSEAGTGGLVPYLPRAHEFTAPNDIAVGNLYECMVTDVGGVRCVGENSWGQLGDGTTENRDAPVDVIGLP